MTDVAQMLRGGQEDLSWFQTHFTELVRKYDGRFIAFQHQQVLGADKDVDQLMHKLQRQDVDSAGVLIRFVSKVKSIL